VRILLGILAILILAGCTPEPKTSPPSKPPPTAEVDPRASSFTNPNTASAVSKERDPGGFTSAYIRNARYAAANNLPVEIRGTCLSSCILKLASGANLCVDPKATLGVHEPRVSGSRSSAIYSGARAEKTLREVQEVLPACAAKLFKEKGGFDGGKMTTFSGREVIEACPQIKKCPN